jgi:hypothetical protein
LDHPSRDVTIDVWLGWFAEAVLEAQTRRINAIGFLIAKTRAKVAARLESNDPAQIDAALAQEALVIGKANVGRAVSDIVRAGLVRRHYDGRVTDHCNRGDERLAVYAVAPSILNAIRSRPTLG